MGPLKGQSNKTNCTILHWKLHNEFNHIYLPLHKCEVTSTKIAMPGFRKKSNKLVLEV